MSSFLAYQKYDISQEIHANLMKRKKEIPNSLFIFEKEKSKNDCHSSTSIFQQDVLHANDNNLKYSQKK